MQEINMFETASRAKFRFVTTKGHMTVEDLWDMPLTSNNQSKPSLDDVAKALHRVIKEDAEESFVVPKKKSMAPVEAKFEIVKHIIRVKLAEASAKEDAAVVKAKKEKILGIIATKEDAVLLNTDLNDLKKMAEGL